MIQRTPVRDLTPPRDIQPAAAPVSTYVRPAQPERSPLHHVAQSLGDLGGSLQGLLQDRQAQADEDARLQGEAEFYRDHTEGYRQAVASGEVPAHRSPAFVEGFNRAQGQNSGIRMRQDFNARFQSWEGRHSASPEEFQSWYGDFVNEHLTSENPEQLRSLLPHVETLTEDAYGTFQRVRGERLMDEAVTTHVGVSAVTIDEAFSQALGQPHGVPADHLWSDLLSQREAALATGVPPARYDETLFNTIITKAIEHEEPALLELLDRTRPGHSVPLSQHPSFLEDRLQMEGRVSRAIATREEAAYQAQLEQDQEREDAIVREVSRTLSEDPMMQIDQTIMDEWAVYDPLARQRLENLRTTFANVREREDPRAILEVELEIMQGVGRQRIMELAGPDGPIRNARTLATLMDRVDQRREFGGRMLQFESYRRLREFLLSRLGARDDPFDLEQPRTKITEEYATAMRDLEVYAIEWLQAHPNASFIEQYRAMDRIGRLISRRIQGDHRAFDDPDYRSQEDYLEALGDQERQAPSVDDPEAASRSDRLPVTPGHGAPDQEPPEEQTRRVLESLSLESR